jgi:DNA-binding response OmpR family regulator
LKKQIKHSALSNTESSQTILVVDDDTPIRSLLRQELTEAGYDVTEAADGKAALDMVRVKKPDLILLDVMMPEINGFDVAAVLKNDPETMDIPIIIISIVQDQERGFKIGVDRYLTKPIDTEKLFHEVDALLEQGVSKKKVLVLDEDQSTLKTLAEVLSARGYNVLEANGDDLLETALKTKPDIIMLNSLYKGDHDLVKTLRFEKGMENVLFFVYH